MVLHRLNCIDSLQIKFYLPIDLSSLKVDELCALYGYQKGNLKTNIKAKIELFCSGELHDIVPSLFVRPRANRGLIDAQWLSLLPI